MAIKQTYHLTAAIPYVNAKPHLGHVLEWFQADAIAKYHQALGEDVSFTCGTDENSLKNVQAAEKAEQPVQEYLDEYAVIFKDAFKFFDIDLTGFRRGSDQEKHWPGVQKLWELCNTSGDIYKKKYKGLYCVGCESFYTETELIDGHCPEHPNQEPELVEEENYFFALSKYEDKIRSLIESDELLIVSDQFKSEMLGFINQGLEDFSVSRSKDRARGVGVPVSNDDSQIMYVWFDALAIYMTAIGWGYDQELWKKYWPAGVHVIGKGINRFHSVYWIGMLLSAGLPLPKAISVHGYITANGQKMSKSLGNVIDPFEVVEQYGLEPIRYYLLKHIPAHSDGDFSHEAFKEAYTADLANGLGNVCSRVAALCVKSGIEYEFPEITLVNDYQEAFRTFDTNQAAHIAFNFVAELDVFLSEQQPWKKSGKEQQQVLQEAVSQIAQIAYHFKPFLPQTSQTIIDHFSTGKIKKLSPLFPRLD